MDKITGDKKSGQTSSKKSKTEQKIKLRNNEKETGKPKTITEPGKEMQIDFSGKFNHKKVNGEYQLLIAVDRFSKWPTFEICKPSETKEVLNFLRKKFNFIGLPEKIKMDKGGAFISKETKNFANREILQLNIAHRVYIPATARKSVLYRL